MLSIMTLDTKCCYAERHICFNCYDESSHAECHYAECHYAECRYAECHVSRLFSTSVSYNCKSFIKFPATVVLSQLCDRTYTIKPFSL